VFIISFVSNKRILDFVQVPIIRVWVQLLIGAVEAGGAVKIRFTGQDVADLCDAAKERFAEDLHGVTAARLTVHQTPDSEALDEEASIPDAKTKATRLYIKAPARVSVAGESPTNPLLIPNICPLRICVAYSSLQFQHSTTISSAYRSQCLPTLTLLDFPLRSYVPTRASVGVGGASGETTNHDNRLCLNLCFQRFLLSLRHHVPLSMSRHHCLVSNSFSFLLFENSHHLVLVVV
jgi:hypothetical protein